jgi:hypothetical protein
MDIHNSQSPWEIIHDATSHMLISFVSLIANDFEYRLPNVFPKGVVSA